MKPAKQSGGQGPRERPWQSERVNKVPFKQSEGQGPREGLWQSSLSRLVKAALKGRHVLPEGKWSQLQIPPSPVSLRDREKGSLLRRKMAWALY